MMKTVIIAAIFFAIASAYSGPVCSALCTALGAQFTATCCDNNNCYGDNFWIKWDTCASNVATCCASWTSGFWGVVIGGGVGFLLCCVGSIVGCICLCRRRGHHHHHNDYTAVPAYHH
eukprot:TRINITY_DN1705_c0_g1_i1.p2 TRINITY_DN1705_c0_g1~~TRINITY_DN1705_c0_g1_i1.p2  ORF type:complete len:118 (-),score=3.14 TRINITY_DN1705_c0_g1_i1:100-453(-)